MKAPRIRIHIQRGVGMTMLSVEAPVEERENAVAAAKELLASMPEATFQGDGIAITSIPMHGPDMDGPMGFIRRPGDDHNLYRPGDE